MTKNIPMPNNTILAEIGKRIAGYRLNNNWTQAELAKKAGIGKGTLERIEKGMSTQMLNIVKILRAFGLLDQLLNIVPEQTLSPMELLAQSRNEQKRKPKRASKRKKQEQLYQLEPFNNNEFTPTNILTESKTKWVWDEDK